MAVFFASDVHLRLDRPERARRFARFVGGLTGSDSLYLVGDLFDFWFVSRELDRSPAECPGLVPLASFRGRGGSLVMLPGNHDAAMGGLLQEKLGIGFTQEPLAVEAHGLRIHLVHGHRLGGRPPWKRGMESHLFLAGFRALPVAVARRLDQLLDRSNELGRSEADRGHLEKYRQYAQRLDGAADLAVFGHIHQARDETEGRPRIVVLGGWHQRSSYLRVDERGARLVIEEEARPPHESD